MNQEHFYDISSTYYGHQKDLVLEKLYRKLRHAKIMLFQHEKSIEFLSYAYSQIQKSKVEQLDPDLDELHKLEKELEDEKAKIAQFEAEKPILIQQKKKVKIQKRIMKDKSARQLVKYHIRLSLKSKSTMRCYKGYLKNLRLSSRQIVQDFLPKTHFEHDPKKLRWMKGHSVKDLTFK